MEQRILDAARQAWESADVAPEPQPPSIPSSEDSGPWPLPLYPVLGQFSCPCDGYEGQLLSSPCWRLPSVYEQYRRLTGAQSTLEASPVQPSLGLWPETPRMPEAPAGEREPAEETAFQSHLVAQQPAAGVTSQDTDTSDSVHASEHRGPQAAAWWSQHRVFSRCLRWIGRTIYTLSCGCCRTFVGAKEPPDCSGSVLGTCPRKRPSLKE